MNINLNTCDHVNYSVIEKDDCINLILSFSDWERCVTAQKTAARETSDTGIHVLFIKNPSSPNRTYMNQSICLEFKVLV